MIKRTQLFGWEQEPVDERPSEFMPSTLSEFSSLGAFDAIAPADASREKLDPVAPQARRSPPSPADMTPSSLVPRWMDSLPAEAQAHYLCARFPRIANRLALCWPDAALTVRLLDDFLADKRGTRRGFPSEALNELTTLRQLASQRVKYELL